MRTFIEEATGKKYRSAGYQLDGSLFIIPIPEEEATGKKYRSAGYQLDESLFIIPIPEKKLKVAFVIGHHQMAQGDYSSVKKAWEWNFWKDFASRNWRNITEKCNVEVHIFRHNAQINSYTDRQKETAQRVKEWGADLALEFHWNAFDPDGDGTDNSEGSEALVWYENYDTYSSAHSWQMKLREELDYKIRSNKLITTGNWKSTNGGGFIKHMPCDAILLEWFFGDSADARKFTDEAGVNALVALIERYKELKQ